MKTSIKVISIIAIGLLLVGLGALGHRLIEQTGVASFDFLAPFHSKQLHIDINAALGKENTFPIVIIGSGPAGLNAATYCGRNKLRTLVIEGNKPGGLLTETAYIENMPGFNAILGKDLVKQMKVQAERFDAEFLDDIVEKIDLDQWPFRITTEDGKVIHTLALIICTGATPKRLGIPGEDEYWGRGVTTCAVCDAAFYDGKEVVVIGGGDSAVEESLILAPRVKKITILVRAPTMRAAAASQELLKGYSNISVRYNIEPKKVLGNQDHVTGLELFNKKTNETTTESIDGIFLAIGHNPNTALFKHSSLKMENGYIVVQCPSQKTSIPGVFAAGDVEDDRYRQACIAAAHGCVAALDAGAFLNEIGFNEKIAAQLQETQLAAVKMVPSLVKKVQSVEEFDQELSQATGAVFVDFYAQYCPSCMQMLKPYDEIATQFKDVATFVSVDIEKLPDLAKKYVVTSVPALIIFKDGKLVGRFNKALTKRELQDHAAEFVGQSPAETKGEAKS